MKIRQEIRKIAKLEKETEQKTWMSYEIIKIEEIVWKSNRDRGILEEVPPKN